MEYRKIKPGCSCGKLLAPAWEAGHTQIIKRTCRCGLVWQCKINPVVVKGEGERHFTLVELTGIGHSAKASHKFNLVADLASI